MFEKTDFGRTLEVVEKGLDAATLRHKVISDNIANVDTPGFRKTRVSFERAMRRALSKEAPEARPQAFKTNSKHFDFYEPGYRPKPSEVKPYLIPIMKTKFRNDVNNVDIDEEMSRLAKNQVLYLSLIQRLGDEMRLMRDVIKQGGGAR